MRTIRSATLMLAAMAATAHGQGDPNSEPRSEAGRVSALPHEANGLVVRREGEATWRVAARVAFFPVRAVWSLTMAAPRAGLQAADKYQLGARLHELFYNDSGTFGIIPSVGLESEFGPSVGVNVVSTELTSKGLSLGARAQYGGVYSRVIEGSLDSGTLMGKHVRAELSAGYEVFSRSLYYGIGNEGDATASRFRHDDLTIWLTAVDQLTEHLAFRLRAGYRRAEFGGDVDTRSDAHISEVYDTAMLTGYDSGLDTLVTDLELSWDTRERPYFAQPWAAPSSGWLARAHVGGDRDLDDGPAASLRWGADLTRHLDLGNGRRVLTLRIAVESIDGDYDDVPFIDLATLGGPYLLRGYTRDRFRDLNAAAATAEYGWAAEQNTLAFLFVDSGRVGQDLLDAFDDDLDTIRVGFGGGLQFHSNEGFLGRVSLATSVDGGLQLALTFAPAADVRVREEQM